MQLPTYFNNVDEILETLKNTYRSTVFELRSNNTIIARIDETKIQRSSFLESIVSNYSSNSKYVKPSSKSSIGHVQIDEKYSIVAKPLIAVNPFNVEEKIVAEIKAFLETTGPIEIEARQFTFANVSDARIVFGNPKADFILYDTENKPCCYISHKKEGNADAFHHYSGISSVADGKIPGSISEHPEIKDFLRKLVDYNYHERIFREQHRFFSYIKDDILIARAIYGSEYGNSSSYGINNVHLIGQGIPIFTKIIDTRYSLNFSDGMEMNGEIDKFKKGDYSAIIGARYGAFDRKFIVNRKEYRNIRVLISPRRLLGQTGIEI